MLFTANQIQEILDIVDRNHLTYSAFNIGKEVLSDWDRIILKRYGIDVDKIDDGNTSFDRAYYWGRLSQQLSDQAKKVEYKDFLQYMRKGQYIPLSDLEKNMLTVAKRKSYSHIKDLGSKIKNQINGMINEEDSKLRAKREKIIGDEIKTGILERKALTDISNSMAKRMGDWNKDFDRIADTEMQNIFNEGRVAQIIKDYGEDASMYKEVFSGACRHCIRLYLTGGIGSKPIVKKVSEVIENGSNIGRKVADWKFIVGATHPHCRCHPRYLDKNKVWDEEKKEFKDKEREVVQRKKNKLTVGDKVYWV